MYSLHNLPRSKRITNCFLDFLVNCNLCKWIILDYVCLLKCLRTQNQYPMLWRNVFFGGQIQSWGIALIAIEQCSKYRVGSLPPFLEGFNSLISAVYRSTLPEPKKKGVLPLIWLQIIGDWLFKSFASNKKGFVFPGTFSTVPWVELSSETLTRDVYRLCSAEI